MKVIHEGFDIYTPGACLSKIKAFSNKNKGHLGSRHISIFLRIQHSSDLVSKWDLMNVWSETLPKQFRDRFDLSLTG